MPEYNQITDVFQTFCFESSEVSSQVEIYGVSPTHRHMPHVTLRVTLRYISLMYHLVTAPEEGNKQCPRTPYISHYEKIPYQG